MTASPAFDHDSFVHRHVGTDASAQRHMLDTLGLESLDELIERAVPSTILLEPDTGTDRKSTRLNSSHVAISYAVFCLKKKKPPKQDKKNIVFLTEPASKITAAEHSEDITPPHKTLRT